MPTAESASRPRLKIPLKTVRHPFVRDLDTCHQFPWPHPTGVAGVAFVVLTYPGLHIVCQTDVVFEFVALAAKYVDVHEVHLHLLYLEKGPH